MIGRASLISTGARMQVRVGGQSLKMPATKYIYTTVPVPSSELGPLLLLPLPQANQRVEGYLHTRLRVRGWGSPSSDDWRKGSALCLLCDASYVLFDQPAGRKSLSHSAQKKYNAEVTGRKLL
jgi:hypothetical protein